jgi:hypothetical protein
VHRVDDLTQGGWLDVNFDKFSDRVCCVALHNGGTLFILDTIDKVYTTTWDVVPDAVDELLRHRSKKLPQARFVALGTNDRFYVQFDNGTSEWGGTPESFDDAIHASDSSVEYVSFGDGDGNYEHHEYWYIQFRDGSADWSAEMPPDFVSAYNDVEHIAKVSLGSDDGFAILSANGTCFLGEHCSYALHYAAMLYAIPDDGTITDIVLGSSADEYCIRYNLD